MCMVVWLLCGCVCLTFSRRPQTPLRTADLLNRVEKKMEYYRRIRMRLCPEMWSNWWYVYTSSIYIYLPVQNKRTQKHQQQPNVYVCPVRSYTNDNIVLSFGPSIYIFAMCTTCNQRTNILSYINARANQHNVVCIYGNTHTRFDALCAQSKSRMWIWSVDMKANDLPHV